MLLCATCRKAFNGHYWSVDSSSMTVRVRAQAEGTDPAPAPIAHSVDQKLVLAWGTANSPIPQLFDLRAAWATSELEHEARKAEWARADRIRSFDPAGVRSFGALGSGRAPLAAVLLQGDDPEGRAEVGDDVSTGSV